MSVRGCSISVKPLLSLDKEESRTRALGLYRAWCRRIPWIVRRFDIPKTAKQARLKLREEFAKNKEVSDTRSIDMLIIRGHMLLRETTEVWLQKTHLMRFYKEGPEPKPKTFMAKYLAGFT